MGSIKKTEDSVNEILRQKYMSSSCSFAYTILKAAERLIASYFSRRLEIDEGLSEELGNDVHIYLSQVENLHGYSHDDIGFCYAPKIQGGHNYNLYLKTISEWEDFGFDFFTCSAGFKLKNHCSHFVRTLLFHPTKQVKENCKFMMLVYEKVLEYLQDGIELCRVYQAAHSFAERKNPNLAKHLEKEFGFELGPNFKNESVVINSSSPVIAKRGMFFAININLIGLQEEGIEYSLYYSDTVFVRQGEKPRIMTHYKPDNITI